MNNDESASVSSSDGLCGCLQCLRDRKETVHGLPMEMCRMIVCEYCGNKRCPHATDHRNACTNSNEPKQQSVREFVQSSPPISSETVRAFTKNFMQVRAKEYLVWLYGKPGQGNDSDKWMERFGLLCGFIDEQFNPTEHD